MNAFKYVNKEGKVTFLRYRIVPVAGAMHFSDAELKNQSATYLFDEILERVAKETIEFRLQAQIAGQDDVTDDCSVIWPEDRDVVELGLVGIDAALSGEDSAREEQQIIFDPVPRVQGIEASDGKSFA